MSANLNDPLQLPCGAVLPNRLAKAAMTEGLATPSGVPTAELERLYGLWSDGGAGMLLSGNIQVDADHLERPGNVVIDRQPDAAMMQGTGQLGAGRHSQWQPLLGTDQPCGPPNPEECKPASQGALCG
jgi:2,4-dienoyl-CoA reductase-like NADH-dependent reductase (Old Yellow Enzyme family)